MSIQTDSMIASAGDNKEIVALQHKDTGEWHGVLMVNHPTPSGCERWMLAYSDKRGWPDAETAKSKFRELLKREENGKGDV